MTEKECNCKQEKQIVDLRLNNQEMQMNIKEIKENQNAMDKKLDLIIEWMDKIKKEYVKWATLKLMWFVFLAWISWTIAVIQFLLPHLVR